MATIISETIRKLPPELREKYLAIKIRQRTALGWKEVHEEFSKQPFCHNRQQLSIIMCLECSHCRWEGLCHPCFNQGIEHKLFYTPPIENITLVKMCSDTFDWHSACNYWQEFMKELREEEELKEAAAIVRAILAEQSLFSICLTANAKPNMYSSLCFQ